ncbi:NAD(P)H-flavin reductase [Anaerosolibacter carboniphilus]|uniref:NAD(P)H-flavin reductase n=1 Tax=Anaerosolibacter carboniphilus TaxID=1417629 RepID=A0A841KSV2_9FIRM|nr:sulfide/dihydroorotate dehydrogenase-like FAD/NAD-binding protein [Anaerosolibacter carboniphilus]MBB6216666.1 NAD(P)H-flavin reductase [Anaerosolibacter carboniphilus]
MSTNKIVTCIDAGSEYCPCYLAESDECITCSQLQGNSFCDCNWSGVCIYQEYAWCGMKKKTPREAVESEIIEKTQFGEQVLILKIRVLKTLARQLKQPGSYVFIRNPEKTSIFDVPMSIMSADEEKGEIIVAIHVLGVKTKSLLSCTNKILVKGPYWNGLIGFKELKNLVDQDVLVVGRGIALAPAVLTIKYLLHHKNRVTFIIDQGRTGAAFIDDHISGLDIKQHYLNLRSIEGLEKMNQIVSKGKYSLVYSGGSDLLHQVIKDQLSHMDRPIRLVAINNHELCCGEGVCGSCAVRTLTGKKVKMCKSQIDIEEIIEGGNRNG